MATDLGLDSALDSCGESILGHLPTLLDALLDSAALARPGADCADHAAALRATAEQVDALARLIGAAAELRQPSPPLRIPA